MAEDTPDMRDLDGNRPEHGLGSHRGATNARSERLCNGIVTTARDIRPLGIRRGRGQAAMCVTVQLSIIPDDQGSGERDNANARTQG
jgi:hypothetical protein